MKKWRANAFEKIPIKIIPLLAVIFFVGVPIIQSFSFDTLIPLPFLGLTRLSCPSPCAHGLQQVTRGSFAHETGSNETRYEVQHLLLVRGVDQGQVDFPADSYYSGLSSIDVFLC